MTVSNTTTDAIVLLTVAENPIWYPEKIEKQSYGCYSLQMGTCIISKLGVLSLFYNVKAMVNVM